MSDHQTLLASARKLRDEIAAGKEHIGKQFQKEADTLSDALKYSIEWLEKLHGSDSANQLEEFNKQRKNGSISLEEARKTVSTTLSEIVETRGKTDRLMVALRSATEAANHEPLPHDVDAYIQQAHADIAEEEQAAHARRTGVSDPSSLTKQFERLAEGQNRFLKDHSNVTKFIVANGEVMAGMIAIFHGIGRGARAWKGQEKVIEETPSANNPGQNAITSHIRQLTSGERAKDAAIATLAVALGIGAVGLGLTVTMTPKAVPHR